MKTLEKRCVNRTFPQIITEEEDKCKNPCCNGYDKYCPQYVATGSFNLHEIEDLLNRKNNVDGRQY